MTTEPLGPVEPIEPSEPQRRVAVVPLILVAVGLVAAIAFGVVVWGLAGAGSSPSEEPSIPPPAAVAPTPTATGSPRVAGPGECADARGDGTGVDLDSVGLSAAGDELRVVFVLDESLPDSDASLEIYAESDAARFQIALAFSDGEVAEFFAYRLPAAGADDQQDPDSDEDDHRGPGGGSDNGRGENGIDEGQRIGLKKRDVTVDGTVIVALVGKGVLAELGDSFRWYAAASSDHEPADACYQPDGTLVPFER